VADLPALRQALKGLRDQPDQLIAIILQQAAAIDELRARVAALEAEVRDLRDRNGRLRQRVAELETAAARPAAPFRLPPDKRCSAPRRPGRAVGHVGQARPQPPQVDTAVVAPLPCCPDCGGPVTRRRPLVQYVEDVPVVRPRVTRVTTYVAHCAQCGPVRSTHPAQVSRAGGAAGVHLGPHAVAIAADLHTRAGLPLRKTCQVLHRLFGLRLTPGGLVQRLAHLATRLRPHYTALHAHLRAGPVVHSDETSWWVGGPGHWLWVFAAPDTTLYRVAAGRGRDVLTETLGADYPGVLVSDCLAIYDGGPRRQQKCYAHHFKAIRTAWTEQATPYLADLRALLQAAQAWATARDAGTAHAPTRRALELAADTALATPRALPHEEAVRRRLAKQRDHLFTFLDDPRVPATNNLAERQLRPAVIARKISCGNKTPRGARTWEVLASLAATCTQRRESFLDLVAQHAGLSPAR
jgi:hypothetical protein